jgi:hypothetical protein
MLPGVFAIQALNMLLLEEKNGISEQGATVQGQIIIGISLRFRTKIQN